MLSFFSVDTIALTVVGYQMSWLELVGTLFNIWCVYLAARKNILTWPVGLVGIVCYLFLFHQIQLYADMLEQAYFFVMTFVGIALWRQTARKKEDVFVQVLSTKERIGWTIILLIGTAILTFITTSLPTWLPALFAEVPSYPWLDALTTMMSFVATYLMAKRYLECWALWIAVDVIGVWLYWVKDVKFISIEYLFFLAIAIWGAVTWFNSYKKTRA